MHTQSAGCPKPEVRSRIVQTSKGPVDVVESGDGWPILYFHGTGAGNEIVPTWEHALINEGFRLIVPNRPGYYGTPLSCGRTPDDCADVAAELLDRFGIDRVAVIGLSGGGLAASSFAARHPARTASLVLQCALCHPFTSPRWMPGHLRWLYPLFRYHRAFLPVLRFGFRRDMRKLRRNPERILSGLSGKRYPEIRDHPAARALVPLLSEGVLRCAWQPAGIENDWANDVGELWLKPNSVRCPTLILHDRADPLIPFHHVEWALHCIPHAEHCDLHAGGHLLCVGKDGGRMREQRAAFLRRHFDSAEETT